jgi:hypothetical protein
MSFRTELTRRAQEYCQRTGLVIGEQLGAGVHGIVFAAENQTEVGRSAIKVHEREACYRQERDVYLRLQEHGVRSIRGCAVPKLLRHDDALWIVEMTVVTRPFVLDFAGAYLDRPPDFSEEVLADWREEKQEQFGARWSDVQAILRSLEIYGVFQVDVSPSNVSLDG